MGFEVQLLLVVLSLSLRGDAIRTSPELGIGMVPVIFGFLHKTGSGAGFGEKNRHEMVSVLRRGAIVNM